MLKMIDLFAGTGAFTYAFEQTGKVQCVFANDNNKYSKIIYDLNFKHPLLLNDLHNIDPKDIPCHDILTAGFPCQPFSIAGERKGFNDARSNVFWKMLEIIDYHHPSYIILENVKNLISHNNKNTFNTIIDQLKTRNYYIHYKILNTVKITGIPQHRERIYILCFKSKLIYEKFNFSFNIVDKLPIHNFLEQKVANKYYYHDKLSVYKLIKLNVVKKNTIYQYRRTIVRENKNNECPTLTANMGSGGHNVPLILDEQGIRKLTPKECFQFQGFPNDYILPNITDSHLYHLAGNAVSIPVIFLIVNQLIQIIQNI